MKSLITNIVAAAAVSLPGATPAPNHQPPAPPPALAATALDADEAELESGLHEAERQVETELPASLESVAAQAGAQVGQARRQMGQELARAERAVGLAQAGASATAGSAAGATAVPAFQQRLQGIVSRAHGGPAKSLVIRTSDAEAKSQGKLEEDLAVMSRILDKKLSELDDEKPRRAMGIDVFLAPGSSPIRSLYLESYGALFMLGVNFPLLPPPEKAEPTKEKSETDSTWDEAKRELYGTADAWSQAGTAFKFAMAGEAPEEYDEKKVDDLKEGLLDALKNATNIRNLKPDETITVCVFGGASASPGTVRKTKNRTSDPSDNDADALLITDRRASARGTIMTLRVKKADVDAFAKGKLNADEFRKKAAVTVYIGDAGGWGGGWGGGGGSFGFSTPGR
jgi:hypothetical protein